MSQVPAPRALADQGGWRHDGLEADRQQSSQPWVRGGQRQWHQRSRGQTRAGLHPDLLWHVPRVPAPLPVRGEDDLRRHSVPGARPDPGSVPGPGSHSRQQSRLRSRLGPDPDLDPVRRSAAAAAPGSRVQDLLEVDIPVQHEAQIKDSGRGVFSNEVKLHLRKNPF